MVLDHLVLLEAMVNLEFEDSKVYMARKVTKVLEDFLVAPVLGVYEVFLGSLERKVTREMMVLL